MKHKDSCGVGFIADINGYKSYKILHQALSAVSNLTHRGAVLADGRTGDGSGVLFQLPVEFFRKEVEKAGENFGDEIAVGTFFIDSRQVDKSIKTVENILKEKNLPFLWREVPVNINECGEIARKSLPFIIQIITPFPGEIDLYILRRKIEKALRQISKNNYVLSFSDKLIVYKGMLLAPDLQKFYPDLNNDLFKTAIAVFHQRYSTNTNPEWKLAQPLRMIAHNGEINTITANRNFIKIVEPIIKSSRFGNRIKDALPVINFDESDSASLDRVFELMVLSGYQPEEAISVLIPPAYEMLDLDDEERAFFLYHLLLMKPWDGPAAVAFTDGKVVGGKLDRNGLRPARYTITEDETVIFGSEEGMIEIDESKVVSHNRLSPGEIVVVNTEFGTVETNKEVLKRIARQRDLRREIRRKLFKLSDLKTTLENSLVNESKLREELIKFGYSKEDLEFIIDEMAEFGKEPVFSMGDDTPLPFISDAPFSLFRFFKQKFAQVTNPPIDPIRERVVMSLKIRLGGKVNFLEREGKLPRRIELESPLLTPGQFENLKNASFMKVETFKLEFKEDLETAIENLFKSVKEAIEKHDIDVVILSDRNCKKPIPSLLAVSGLLNFLKKENLMHKISIVVETGEVKTTHEIAALVAFGASAVYPYLVFEYLKTRVIELNLPYETLIDNYKKAVNNGLLKIMSKMGISLLSSYHLSQNFDILGLSKEVVDKFFPHTFSPIGGMTLKDIEREINRNCNASETLEDIPESGALRFKPGKEKHGFSPQVVRAILKSAKTGNFEEFEKLYDYYNENPIYIRDLLKIESDRKPIPIEEVEPVESIVKHLMVPGMSVGALSKEAHEVLAEAMNLLGAKSCSGEGGEDPERYYAAKNSKIKQVASGRFGVTPSYLASAEEIEIKIAQGAKPGEGGHLPGKKVTKYIAQLRFSIPGVTLISPPPHHDIYSIEDLAQLIYDLKLANPKAKIAVKLVAESGVGTVAAGVAKAKADVIQISGSDGGTGASPITSIKGAGLPWEIGLPETHRTLIENGLRENVTLRVDGGIKCGRDIIIAALLGAEEFGIGTAAMIAEGCVMDRECHTNRCPVGIATQDEERIKRFKGKVESVINYFKLLAEDVRRHLARLGYKNLKEITGKSELLKPDMEKLKKHSKASSVDFGYITSPSLPFIRVKEPYNPISSPLNERIVEDAKPFIENGEPFRKTYLIKNVDRGVGIPLAYIVNKHFGSNAPKDLIKLTFKGTAGQSFGAFLTNGISLYLKGIANDYVGKGMGGGLIVLNFADNFKGKHYENVIAGNTLLYGATGGMLFASGKVGERFAVRNSGAVAVVEGIGQHGCEYMVRGVVVILGEVGMNFGAGMTGGVAYILDGKIEQKINRNYVKVKELSQKDADFLKVLISKHYRFTKSERAAEILENHFIFEKLRKVVPLNEREVEEVSIGSTGLPD
ncbi:glutamate synthase large subunit [Desulfurobacterium atlanticum]|uniref:Glutamate synthase (NADPH/NADH) large chain n=1 Tax=Desulfurobacterium atlanticum TaxID=240169 RepID=A0A238XM55_9BACT|nr:glutamate synthase large subunit [Desulfurobacterium atlanticum]SNR60075.1 glutamate synthase (NADPH/NADH) large chain [Desulfurobacterium atlanticum]